MNAKLAKFEETRRFTSVVFCVQCGSRCIDQNSLTELRCYHCGNTLVWDARKFSIDRNNTGEDAQETFEREAKDAARKPVG